MDLRDKQDHEDLRVHPEHPDEVAPWDYEDPRVRRESEDRRVYQAPRVLPVDPDYLDSEVTSLTKMK